MRTTAIYITATTEFFFIQKSIKIKVKEINKFQELYFNLRKIKDTSNLCLLFKL